MGHYGIRTDHTLKFTHPDIDNGVLLLNLRNTVNVTLGGVNRRIKE